VRIKTRSNHFVGGKIKMEIRYKDEFDRDFKTNKVMEIKILNMPWYARIVSFFQKLF